MVSHQWLVLSFNTTSFSLHLYLERVQRAESINLKTRSHSFQVRYTRYFRNCSQKKLTYHSSCCLGYNTLLEAVLLPLTGVLSSNQNCRKILVWQSELSPGLYLVASTHAPSCVDLVYQSYEYAVQCWILSFISHFSVYKMHHFLRIYNSTYFKLSASNKWLHSYLDT